MRNKCEKIFTHIDTFPGSGGFIILAEQSLKRRELHHKFQLVKKIKNLILNFYKMPKLDNQKLDVRDIEEMLFDLTGVQYNFAISDSMQWGPNGEVLGRKELQYEGAYQLVPKHTKDINDVFFNWYEEQRADYQDFPVKEDAVITFIHYWLKWKKLSQPETH